MNRFGVVSAYRFHAGEAVPDWVLRVVPVDGHVRVKRVVFAVQCDVVCYDGEVAILPDRGTRCVINVHADGDGPVSLVKLGLRGRLFMSWSEYSGAPEEGAVHG